MHRCLVTKWVSIWPFERGKTINWKIELYQIMREAKITGFLGKVGNGLKQVPSKLMFSDGSGAGNSFSMSLQHYLLLCSK